MKSMYEEDDLIPISALQHMAFCARRAALIYLEGLWDENEFTARGTLQHQRAHEAGTEVRGDVLIVRGARLRSLRHGLTGAADVVEYHRCDSNDALQGARLQHREGFWLPRPVEYKSGQQRDEESYAIQLCAQAMCLEEMLDVTIPEGSLFYAASQRRLDVSFSASLRRRTTTLALDLHHLMETKETPLATMGPRCRSCSLKPLCLPTVAHRSALQYISETVRQDGRTPA